MHEFFAGCRIKTYNYEAIMLTGEGGKGKRERYIDKVEATKDKMRKEGFYFPENSSCVQFNPCNKDTSLIWTLSSVPLVSAL